MIDLDRFKKVNDTHRHAKGDRVFIQISHKLRDVVDYPATVARLQRRRVRRSAAHTHRRRCLTNRKGHSFRADQTHKGQRTPLDGYSNHRNLDIKIAIDDFGRGYSSLSHLVDYLIDLIILDRSTVDEVVTAPGSALVLALINLAHAINAKVCASEFETELQLRNLIDLGVDLMSGYCLGNPQPIEQLSESIQRKRQGLDLLDARTQSISQTEHALG
ncbi:MAG: EAL domain-containing protein [Actinomycetota bacterium]|nr:EAL domain-containing protein [Actinomycetota bacterium]